MPPDSLHYRNPSTEYVHRPTHLIILAALGGTLFIASAICCITTWSAPAIFIFLPTGDAAAGFRSHHGWIEWIQYTDWDKRETTIWSLPWHAPFALELLPAYLLHRRARKPAA